MNWTLPQTRSDCIRLGLGLFPGLALCGLAIAYDYISGNPNTSFGGTQIFLLVIGLILTLLGILFLGFRLETQRRLLLIFYSASFSLIAFEVAFGLHCYFNGCVKGAWLYEDSGRTIQFDPIRGYTLTQVPSRFAYFGRGNVEYIGTHRGNSLGFPDRDEFGPRRDRAKQKRFAVFGDSFTSAQFLEMNWCDRSEDLRNAQGEDIRLLNFSVSGAGLGNWWSILTKLVLPDRYELDGVIFATFLGDLERRFTVAEHRGHRQYVMGRAKSWQADVGPLSFDDANLLLEPLNGWILSRSEFDAALAGKTPSELRRFQPFIVQSLYDLVSTKTFAYPCLPANWDPQQLLRIEEMNRALQSLNIQRRIVVYIAPLQEVVSDGPPWKCPLDKERDFARRLGAEFVDGRDLFRGMSGADKRSLFFRYDGHWNQNGSDLFARFMASYLAPETGSK